MENLRSYIIRLDRPCITTSLLAQAGHLRGLAETITLLTRIFSGRISDFLLALFYLVIGAPEYFFMLVIEVGTIVYEFKFRKGKSVSSPSIYILTVSSYRRVLLTPLWLFLKSFKMCDKKCQCLAIFMVIFQDPVLKFFP